MPRFVSIMWRRMKAMTKGVRNAHRTLRRNQRAIRDMNQITVPRNASKADGKEKGKNESSRGTTVSN